MRSRCDHVEAGPWVASCRRKQRRRHALLLPPEVGVPTRTECRWNVPAPHVLCEELLVEAEKQLLVLRQALVRQVNACGPRERGRGTTDWAGLNGRPTRRTSKTAGQARERRSMASCTFPAHRSASAASAVARSVGGSPPCTPG